MDIPGSAITHKTNIYPSTKCPDGQGKKKMKQVSTAPMGKKRKKNEAQVSKAPMGKEKD